MVEFLQCTELLILIVLMKLEETFMGIAVVTQCSNCCLTEKKKTQTNLTKTSPFSNIAELQSYSFHSSHRWETSWSIMEKSFEIFLSIYSSLQPFHAVSMNHFSVTRQTF